MKKAQEISPSGSSPHKNSPQRTTLSSNLQNVVPSSSSKIPFGQILHNMAQEKERIKENRELGTGTPKKKNRRRERPRKNKSFQQLDTTSSTPLSSPITKKPTTSPAMISMQLISKYAQMDELFIETNKKKFKDELVPKQSLEEFFGNLSMERSRSGKAVPYLLEQKYSFEIHPVKRPCNSYLFRKRSKKYKYINLKSFIRGSKTCIFETKIQKLSYGLKSLSTVGRNKGRKYPETLKLGNKITASARSYTSLTDDNSTIDESSYMELSNLTRDNSVPEYTLNESSSVEDRSIQVKQESSHGSQTSTPKKSRRHRKEKHNHNKKNRQEGREKFPDYFTEDEAKKGLEKGELVKGFLRVNPKNSRDSYVSNEDSSLPDYYITSVIDRNRALDGDEVVLKIKPENEWFEGKKTATVVYISKQIHPRIAVGVLKPIEGNDFAAFYPRDQRLPVMVIPSVSWPNGFKMNPKLYQHILVAAKLIEWKEPDEALGVITETLGLSGDLKVETMSILKEYCLDITPFSSDMKEYLPESKEIPPKELEYREDIRKECVFTIDPLTARDLDDAVSVKELPNGNYEIGVHISDASFFLREGTSLDKMVSEKATTIYLVDNVYHMLPVELCLHCSLLPGEDKLAFSVFWEMNEKGDVFSVRYARTVLNSCAQLAYEHAQQMIENPDKEFSKDELPQIYNGFTSKDLSRTVNILQKIAINLREARMKNGSLRIDQVKLLFSLNPKSGEPQDFVVYENKESHRLIEEFMLLANISVATKINESFPDIAFLRCHEPPKATMLSEAQKCLETCGIHIDVSSSGSINASLRKYITEDFQGLCRGIVLNHIFAKPMTRARYFCSSTMDSEDDYAHFALSVPIYTHFTSPIRRYADIMVHRLLAASLGYAEKPQWNVDRVCEIAANCNKQKYNAKRAGEASSDLYLAHYIEQHQPYIQDCVVVDVKDRSFDAIVLKTGSVIRVYQKRCQDNPSWKIEAIPTSSTSTIKKQEYEKKVLRLTMKFPKTKKVPEEQTMVVEMFSVVKVKLKKVPKSYKLDAYLLRPLPSKTFHRNTVNTSK